MKLIAVNVVMRIWAIIFFLSVVVGLVFVGIELDEGLVLGE